MTGRGLRKLLRCSDCRLKGAAPALVNQRRTFTSSLVYNKHGAVPSFPEVSSPELQGLLSTMRETVFLPAHLSKPHRNLIYGARYRKSLEDDPVKVDIAGEEFQLKHIDRTKDQPGTVKGLFEIIAIMEDKKDWKSLPMLLEGLKSSGRNVKPQYLEKLVRKAGQAGRQDVIVECARMVSRTGFVLRDLDLVRKIMWWFQYMPWSSDGKSGRLNRIRKTLLKAEQVAFMLEEERHSGGIVRGNSDPRVRPEIAGVLLELASMHANLLGGKDVDGKVEIYAKRLLGTLARDIDLRQDVTGAEEWHKRSALLCNVTPIVYGIREAINILGSGSETAEQLRQQLPTLSELVSSEYEHLRREMPEGSSPLGVWCYEKLMLGEQTRE